MTSFNVISPAEKLRMLNERANAAVGNANQEYLCGNTQVVLKTLLADNKASYQLNFFPDATTLRPNERRLQRNDAFVIYGVSMFIAKINTAATGAGATNKAANAPYNTFPDPGVFVGNPTAAGLLNESDVLEAIYQGSWFIKQQAVDRTVNKSTTPFRLVPERAYTATGTIPAQVDFRDTQVELEPMVVLSGQDDNRLILQLGDNADLNCLGGTISAAGAAADTVNELTFIFHGFLYQGASAVALRNGLY